MRRALRGRGALLLALNLLLVLLTAGFLLHQQRATLPAWVPGGGDAPRTAPREDRVPTVLPGVDAERVLAALPPDTRRTLRLLLRATDRPLDRGGAARLERTLRQARSGAASRGRIDRELRERAVNTRRATRRLQQLERAVAGKGGDVTRAVAATGTVVGVLARREQQLRSSLRELPATLRGTQAALGRTADLAAALPPALAALRPLAAQLEPTLDALQPFLEQTTPVLRDQLRPVVQDTTPTLRRLRAAARSTADRAPDVTATVTELSRAANLLAYDPPGSEQGYLFWGQWLTQLAPWVFTGRSAAGPVARTPVLVTCSTLTQLTAAGRVSPTAAQAAGAFDDLIRSGLCPKRPTARRGAR